MKVFAQCWNVVFMALLVPAAYGEVVERSLPADPQGSITIVNVAGEVKVEGWDQPEVKLTANLGSGVEKLVFETQDKTTVIKVILPRGGASSGASQLKIRVPQGSDLTINTVSADQWVRAVRGSQRLQAISGCIDTQQWAEELRIKTISGDVAVEGHEKPALSAVETVSGDLTAGQLAGEVNLISVTGDMQVTMSELARGTIQTTNGDVRLRTRLARDARLETESVNGDVRLQLLGAIDADFDIETFNGDIDSCFGPKPTRTREFAPGNTLRFKQGAASSRIRIKTLNGAVGICRD